MFEINKFRQKCSQMIASLNSVILQTQEQLIQPQIVRTKMQKEDERQINKCQIISKRRLQEYEQYVEQIAIQYSIQDECCIASESISQIKIQIVKLRQEISNNKKNIKNQIKHTDNIKQLVQQIKIEEIGIKNQKQHINKINEHNDQILAAEKKLKERQSQLKVALDQLKQLSTKYVNCNLEEDKYWELAQRKNDLIKEQTNQRKQRCCIQEKKLKDKLQVQKVGKEKQAEIQMFQRIIMEQNFMIIMMKKHQMTQKLQKDKNQEQNNQTKQYFHKEKNNIKLRKILKNKQQKEHEQNIFVKSSEEYDDDELQKNEYEAQISKAQQKIIQQLLIKKKQRKEQKRFQLFLKQMIKKEASSNKLSQDNYENQKATAYKRKKMLTLRSILKTEQIPRVIAKVPKSLQKIPLQYSNNKFPNIFDSPSHRKHRNSLNSQCVFQTNEYDIERNLRLQRLKRIRTRQYPSGKLQHHTEKNINCKPDVNVFSNNPNSFETKDKNNDKDEHNKSYRHAYQNQKKEKIETNNYNNIKVSIQNQKIKNQIPQQKADWAVHQNQQRQQQYFNKLAMKQTRKTKRNSLFESRYKTPYQTSEYDEQFNNTNSVYRKLMRLDRKNSGKRKRPKGIQVHKVSRNENKHRIASDNKGDVSQRQDEISAVGIQKNRHLRYPSDKSVPEMHT